MPRSDRLSTVAACHGVLRHNRLTGLDVYRAATTERLAGLHRYRADIRRLVAAGNPDVLAAPLPPRGISWSISRLTYDPHDRHLTVIRAPWASSMTRCWMSATTPGMPTASGGHGGR
jgi:hypothetical protein